MAETIKCSCSHCGAKYRLPVEAAGRTARCKKCGEKFGVPSERNLEDSILDWLSQTEDEVEEPVTPPRVITMPKDDSNSEAVRKAKGPIRLKETAPRTAE